MAKKKQDQLLSDMTVAELETQAQELNQELQKKRLEKKVGRGNHGNIGLIADQLARVKTFLTQKYTAAAAKKAVDEQKTEEVTAKA